ncbi:MAG: dihydroorotase [Candidatus Omnitrophica bacterium]|nr:dihydroorotase [Candidatus Omnitrophota bacterium]
MKILIKNGRVIDPANNIEAEADILIENGKIQKVSKDLRVDDAEIIEAKGKIVAPGLVDMHCHLREPGREDEETLLSASRAASKGGFTTICAMPNTIPPCDNQGVVGFITSESKRIGLCNIFVIGTITKGRMGQELSEIGELKKAGVVGLSDDGDSVDNSELMRRALEYASMFSLPLIAHCEDKLLSKNGVMNESFFSTVLGLRGCPAISESIRVARELELCAMTKGRLHIAHVSTKRSVELMRDAKKRGINATCETAPHYFALTDEAVKTSGFDTNTKMNPPLRTAEDLEAIKQGLLDGTIDAIATDHAPHTEDEKDTDFDSAPFGIIGLETALPLAVMELIDKAVLKWPALIEKMSVNPAKILGLNKGRLSIGDDADIVIIDPDAKWQVTKETIASKSKNTPFLEKSLKGAAVLTINSGRVVYRS